MRFPARSVHRGLPLWIYLAAFITIPQAGVTALIGAVAVYQHAGVESVERAGQAVRTLSLLEAARNSVEREIVPALARTLVADPALADYLGVPADLVADSAESMAAAAGESRTTTEHAIDALPAEAAASEPVVRAERKLAELRADLDTGGIEIEDAYFAYLDVSNTLAQAQNQASTAAMAEGIPARTLRATHDVEIAAALSQSSARLVPLFLATQLGAEDFTASLRLAGGSAWVAYQDAQRQMSDLSSVDLRRSWQILEATPAMSHLDELLAADAAGTQPRLGAGQIIPLLAEIDERDSGLSDLVGQALGRAKALTTADAERVEGQFWLTVRVGVGLVLVGAGVAIAVGLRLRRAIRQLTDQADRVSEGFLEDVRVHGPREVRTVSAALASTVASLRRIQAQAAAVSRGELDDALLDEPLPGPLGEVVHASVRQIVTSVREREQLQVALAHRATHDPLTELPNRAQARTLATAALHRGLRSGDMTGLLFVDLDGFKSVNDTRGHAAGDEVLRVVSRRMRSVVRPGDVVCRLGGDEFVVLLEQVATEHDLLDLAERLIATVSLPVPIGDAEVRVGASVGVAVSRDGGTDADALFAEADTAAYRAKARGRGRAEIFDEALRHQLSTRAEMEAAVSAALDNGEMQLHYQPVVDIGTGRLAGYEALLRWHRPGVGIVPPDSFIPIAENSSLICEIDRWVLGEATRQLDEWRRTKPTPAGEAEPTMAVNISGRHLSDPRVVEEVTAALTSVGLPPRLLVLEVTETVLVNDPMAIGHLTALRDLGVGIAIDDFGTGYTSIGQLRHMPVDTLKIDRSFVASADAGNQELVSLMIRAAHTFGLTVVAEGVEESGQLARLRAESCDHAQGYLLHRPLPAAEAGALLALTAEV